MSCAAACCSPPPCGEEIEVGVGRRGTGVDDLHHFATPTPSPPHKGQGINYSAFMPAFLTTGPHLASSASMNLPNSAALMCTGAAPSLSRNFLVVAESRSPAMVSCSLSTIGAGVPAGTTMPHQLVAT